MGRGSVHYVISCCQALSSHVWCLWYVTLLFLLYSSRGKHEKDVFSGFCCCCFFQFYVCFVHKWRFARELSDLATFIYTERLVPF